MQVAQRIDHRRGVADLPGEVEHDVGVGQHVGDARVADVAHLDVDVEALDVAQVAAVVGHERVDDPDPCAGARPGGGRGSSR